MKEPSIRCGVGGCENYSSSSISKCSIYPDRNLCTKANKNKRKNKNHSRRLEKLSQ